MDGQDCRQAHTAHINEAHATKCMENFFILALGEGMFLLVRESPLGQELSTQLARGVLLLAS